MSDRDRPIVVLGAGGHGKVVADIVRAMGHEVLGFLDQGVPAGTAFFGAKVLGDDTWLRDHPADVALGIGDNAARERLALAALATGARLLSAIHPRAVVAASARVADGVVIAALGVINPDAVVERGVIVNTGALVEHDCVIGEFAHLATNATTGGAVRIGRLALLGSGATMLPRTSLGDGAIAGSQAVLTRDVAPGLVVRGIPARRARQL